MCLEGIAGSAASSHLPFGLFESGKALNGLCIFGKMLLQLLLVLVVLRPLGSDSDARDVKMIIMNMNRVCLCLCALERDD
ncbi:hypothetical protein VNO77_33229 [Canavalia gladiata]|uniref:Uncharacterized protein n=1 Tax=Canavalia gladiata TaxID=3824 RepID=A0AAN9PY59_CANGL